MKDGIKSGLVLGLLVLMIFACSAGYTSLPQIFERAVEAKAKHSFEAYQGRALVVKEEYQGQAILAGAEAEAEIVEAAAEQVRVGTKALENDVNIAKRVSNMPSFLDLIVIGWLVYTEIRKRKDAKCSEQSEQSQES